LGGETADALVQLTGFTDGVEDVELAIRRVVWVESEAEQAGLTSGKEVLSCAGGHQSCEVEEFRRRRTSGGDVWNDADDAGLFTNEEPLSLARRRG
jgi:hypothetical protein